MSMHPRPLPVLAGCLALAACAAGDLRVHYDDISSRYGLQNVNGTAAAFGDWDSDHMTDVFIVYKNKISVLSGDWLGKTTSADSLELIQEITLEDPDAVVANLIATDLNHDGKLDILVQSTTPGAGGALKNFVGLQYDGDVAKLDQLPASTNHFLAVNLFGTLRVDLVATLTIPAAGGGTVDRTAVLQNLGCASPLETPCSTSWSCYVDMRGVAPNVTVAGCSEVSANPALDPFLVEGEALAVPADSATLDLDGDCRADTVLSFQDAAPAPARTTRPARTLRFLRSLEPGLTPFGPFTTSPQSIAVAPEVGFITWADVDTDGDMDMIAPFCTTAECTDPTTNQPRYDAVIVVRNQQDRPGCPSYDCCSPRNPGFAFTDISTQAAVLGAPGGALRLTKLRDGEWLEAEVYDPAIFGGGGPYPPVVRVGSFDNDMHPDIVLTTDAPSRGRRSVSIWTGVGDGGFLFEDEFGVARRHAYRTPRLACFFDLSEDGVMDLFVQGYNTETGAPTLQLMLNSVHHSNRLFFKTLGLNGVCHNNCPGPARHPSPRPYGVNQPGVFNKIYWKSPGGDNIYAASTQLLQSQHLSLGLPYSFFPLGNTNNYIEIYFAGYHIADVARPYMSWPSLLPNAQVVVVNYPPMSPEDWTLEQLVIPSGFTKWIIITMCVTLALLVIPIFVLRRREIAEDALESRDNRAILPM